jgi:hypothetical protein
MIYNWSLQVPRNTKNPYGGDCCRSYLASHNKSFIHPKVCLIISPWFLRARCWFYMITYISTKCAFKPTFASRYAYDLLSSLVNICSAVWCVDSCVDFMCSSFEHCRNLYHFACVYFDIPFCWIYRYKSGYLDLLKLCAFNLQWHTINYNICCQMTKKIAAQS